MTQEPLPRIRRARAVAASRLIQALQDRQRGEHWHGYPAKHMWSLWTPTPAPPYSHPWSWNEIGFGGPASLAISTSGVDAREKWEKADHLPFEPVPF